MKKVDAPPSAPGAKGANSLERLFEHARDDGFDRGEMNALWNRVGPIAPVAPRVPGEAPTVAGGSHVAAGVGVKTIAVLLIGGGLVASGGIAQFWPSSHRTESASFAVVAPAPVRAPEDLAHVVGSVAPPPRAVDVRDLPVVPEPSRPGPSGQGRVAQAQRLAEPGELRAPALERATPQSVQGAPIGAPPSQGPSPAADDRPGPSPQLDPPPNEGALLLQARRELTADPAAALALAQEHAHRFPAGALVPEREVLAIEALARLGRGSDARRRLDLFRARFPQSPHISRLDALVAAAAAAQ